MGLKCKNSQTQGTKWVKLVEQNSGTLIPALVRSYLGEKKGRRRKTHARSIELEFKWLEVVWSINHQGNKH